MSRLVNGTIVSARVGDIDIRGIIENYIFNPDLKHTNPTQKMYDVHLHDGTDRTVRIPHFLVQPVTEYGADAIEAKQTQDQRSPVEQLLDPLLDGALVGTDGTSVYIPQGRNTVPVYVTGIKKPLLPMSLRDAMSFEVQGSVPNSVTGSKLPVTLTPLYCRPSPTSDFHYELFGNCIGKSKGFLIVEFGDPFLGLGLGKQLQLVVNDRGIDFVKLQTEEQILYQQNQQTQQILRDLGTLKVPPCAPINQGRANMINVLQLAQAKLRERLVLLRGGYSKCNELLDFLHIQPADHDAIRSHLDFVEASTFLEVYESDRTKNVSDLMNEARCKRVAYFREKFVAGGAKHSGDEMTKNADSFLRDLTAKSGSLGREAQILANRVRERESNAKHRSELSNLGIERISENIFSFPERYRGENRVQGLMEQLSQRLLRVIEGSAVLDKEGQTVQVAKIRGNEDVEITPEFLDSLPTVAQAMVRARELDAVCFSSCLNFEDDPIKVQSHITELRNTSKIALLEFSGNRGILQVIELIKQGLRDGTLKKYLKYKMKYQNLKKQLNL